MAHCGLYCYAGFYVPLAAYFGDFCCLGQDGGSGVALHVHVQRGQVDLL